MTAVSMAAVRRILVVTTSRADYSHVQWLLHSLKSHAAVDLKIVAFGPHLSPEFGRTVQEIGRDGFVVDEVIESLLSSDTDVGMAKSLGLATLGLADTLGRLAHTLKSSSRSVGALALAGSCATLEALVHKQRPGDLVHALTHLMADGEAALAAVRDMLHK